MRAQPLVAGLIVGAALIVRAISAGADPLTHAAIDPKHSSAQFRIEHIFVEHVSGTVPILGGIVEVGAGSAAPLHVAATLDATNIHTDEPDRDSSLKSADYFDVQRFPTWTFASTKIVATGPGTFAMDGLLTMHGIAQPEHLDVTQRGSGTHPLYHAVGSIDRHAFGMKGARLDPVIGDHAEITLDIALE